MSEVIFQRPKSLLPTEFHYCPGCHHGIIHRLIAEVIDELGLQDTTIGVVPVGCSVLAYDYFDVDVQEAAHGRATAVATGIKRVHPDKIVFTYQGDGDFAAIGTAESIHIAARSENITSIFVNNAIYGMTGGQMSPTTLAGQVTTTSPYGRDPNLVGTPIRMAELISTIDGAKYVERVAVDTPINMVKAKAAIKKGFELQIAGGGYSLIEVLSTCPTNWGMSPIQAVQWMREQMFDFYPLGVFKTPKDGDK